MSDRTIDDGWIGGRLGDRTNGRADEHNDVTSAYTSSIVRLLLGLPLSHSPLSSLSLSLSLSVWRPRLIMNGDTRPPAWAHSVFQQT